MRRPSRACSPSHKRLCKGAREMASGRVGGVARAPMMSRASQDGAHPQVWSVWRRGPLLSDLRELLQMHGAAARAETPRERRGRGAPRGGRLARRRRDARAARRPRDGALRRARALGRTDVGHEGSRRGEGDVRADPRRLFRVPAPQEGGADARARARSPRPRAPRASPSLTRLSPFCLRAVRARSADHRSGQREGGPPPLGRRARFHKRASIGAALVDQWGLAASGRPRC